MTLQITIPSNNKLIYRSLLLLLTFFVCNKAISQSVYIKHFTINDGLAGNHTYQAHQDKDGNIWITTTAGLSKFDGETFKNYNYRDGLLDNETLAVVNDEHNNIWVSSFSKKPYISKLESNHNRDRIKNVLIEESEEDKKDKRNKAKTFSLHFSNAIYATQKQACYIYSKYSVLYIRSDREPYTIVSSIYPGHNNTMFETNDGGVFLYNGNSLQELKDSIIIKRQDINLNGNYSSLSYYDNKLYIAQKNKIHIYDHYNKKFKLIKTISLSKDISIIHANQYGMWLFYLSHKGCELLKDINKPEESMHISIDGFISHMIDDKEGGVWMCSEDNGIFYIPNIHIENYTNKDGLSSSVIYSIAVGRDDKLWLGYNTGDVEKVTINKKGIRVNKKFNSARSNTNSNFVTDIIQYKESTYFLSRLNLSKVHNDKLQRLKNYSSFKSFQVINDTTFGIGGIRYELRDNNFKHKQAFHINRVYTQAVDTSNNIVWLGGIDGLYTYKINSTSTPEPIEALKGVRINSILLDNGFIWIGTHNQGLLLAQKDAKGFKVLKSRFNKITQSTITKIAKGAGKIWAGGNAGVWYGVFNYDDLKFNSLNLINHNDGLISPEINDIEIKDATVYLATYGGLIMLKDYVPGKLAYTLTEKHVKSLEDGKVFINDNIVIPYSVKGIELGMKTSAVKYKDEVVYKYMLYPFDKEWNTTKSGMIKYTNIPPGEYDLSVIITDDHGNTSSYMHTMHVVIAPQFWQTVYFKVLILIVILAITSFILFWYFKNTQKKAIKELAIQKLIAKTKLEALKAQLKPHFIFNCLNALNDYIFHHKYTEATTLLQRFSTFIRNGLELADDDFITIEDEVTFLKNYLEIEQAKCDNCFEYTIDASNNIKSHIIPSLITQPFVENAVIHGVSTAPDRGKLEISYNLVGDDIVCSIIDNGVGIKKSLSKKIAYKTKAKGTIITKERIEYFKSGMDIDIELKIVDLQEIDSMSFGTHITIIIKGAANFKPNEN